MTVSIAFVYLSPSSFVLSDRSLLQRHARLLEFQWSGRPRPARELARWLVQNRQEFDVVFVWFGDTHASVAARVSRVLRKPCIVVVGGYDVSTVPGYGFLSTRAGLRRAKGHFQRATRILAVSDTLRQDLERRFPFTAPKMVVLPTGVDVERFRPLGSKERRVLTVAGATEWKRAWVKGWDRVADVARSIPDVPFLAIGAPPSVASELNPPLSMEIRDAVAQDALVPEYQRAAVYLQASRTEGLPNTVMEAMACECVPVVTRVGGMPELVDGAGIVVEEDPNAIAKGVEEALRAPERGLLARRRVAERFSLAQRERGLLAVLEGVLGRSVA